MFKTVMACRPRVLVVREAGKSMIMEDLILPMRAVGVVSPRGIRVRVRSG